MTGLKCLVAAALILMTGSANAMTISNNDTVDYQVTIVEGDHEAKNTLAAGGTLEHDCASGCLIRLAGVDSEFEAQADDVLMIKDGTLAKDLQ